MTSPEPATTIEPRLGARGVWWPTELMRAPEAVEFAAARQALGVYIGLPNYFQNWFRLGFDESDLAEGGSDRLVDALVPWGTLDQVEARLQEHVDAGATHLCLQPLKPGGAMGEPDRGALEALAPGR